MSEAPLFLIDVEKILREKAPKQSKYIPSFVVSYLKRIVHQEELNPFLRDSQHKVGVDFLKASLDFLDTKLIIKGEENLPKEGLYTFVSNHPLGGQDGLALGYVLGTFYNGKVKYMVNDLLMHLHGLAPLCIPINKVGRQPKDFPRMVDAGFGSDNQMIVFPADLCSRRKNGVIRDVAWKKTFIIKSVQFQRDVVPIHFEGQNSNFFYNLANICKRLGIKFNIAMLYLADEMMKNRHKTFTITIGKPIPWQTFDKSKTPVEWAACVRETVYNLDKQP
ncbi:MAG: glycerol acyltransferase [Mediterranea sp.]|jgi:putative hemolysin|nr:glycerol acyltransferase [Mediterranea sp.]